MSFAMLQILFKLTYRWKQDSHHIGLRVDMPFSML